MARVFFRVAQIHRMLVSTGCAAVIAPAHRLRGARIAVDQHGVGASVSEGRRRGLALMVTLPASTRTAIPSVAVAVMRTPEISGSTSAPRCSNRI